MNKEEAYKTLKENLCVMCAYGSQNMELCDIRSCDNRDAIKALEQEPCEDAISREAVLDEISDYNNDLDYTTNELYDRIKRMSSVNPQPKTGHWIDDEFGSKCSCCGIHTHLDKFDRPMKFKHCSMCGAKMVELQESEELRNDT